jgi:hypothetical protein
MTWQRLRRIPPLAILGVGWLWLVVYAYPGVMTMDSLDQLREGREWFFTDSHPPVMAALWGVLDRIVAGPITMLLIQSSAFLLGLYLILRRLMTPRAAALCACAVFVFPPVFSPLAVIWKDCLMAAALVLGIAAVQSERRRTRILGLVAFALATSLRYNALAATFPLVVLLFEWERGKRWYVRYAISAATWLAITVVALGGNALLTDRKMHFWHSSLALQDIAGVLAFVEPDVPDSELRPLLAPTEIKVDSQIHAAVRAQYRSNDFQQLLTGAGALWDVPWTDPLPEARRDAITNAWKTLIKDHPGAYMRYRLENFGETLGVNEKFVSAMVVPHRAQYPALLEKFGFGRGYSKLQRRVEDAYLWLAKNTRLWRPHVYALLALGLLLVAWRQRDVLAFLLSGLFMELTMLVLGGTADYRYSHWLTTMTCLSLVMLIARRARERGA